MSDIRFNQWLHQSGTGGVSQVASGAVGVGTTNPLADFYVRGDAQITGILTAGHIAMGSSITFGDGDRAYFGDGTDMQLYHNGTNSYIENGTNALNIKSYQTFLQNANGSEDYLKATDGYGVELYHNNNKRIETTGLGVTVFGTTQTQQLNVSGVTTMTGNVIISGDIAHDADSDTTFGFGAGADTFRVQTAGNERLRITSTGRLGLNMASPQRRVHIHTTGSGSDYIQFTNDTTGTTSTSGYVFGISGDEDVIHNNFESTNMRFYTAGSERLRIDSSGRVMIGNTAAGQMFGGADDLIVGTTSGARGITIISENNTVGRLLFSDSLTSGTATYQGQVNFNHSTDTLDLRTYTGGSITLSTSNTERVTINSSGYVGINDATGNARLIIKGNSDVGDNDCQLRIYDMDTTVGSQIPSLSFWGGSTQLAYMRGTSSGLRFYTGSSGSMAFAGSFDNNQRLLVGNDSNIAVLSSNPRLQVIGASDSTAHLSIGNFSANTTGAILSLVKSRGSVGAANAVQDDDVIGKINFVGADGTDLTERAGSITVACDAAVANNRVPSRMEFHTTDGNGNLDLNMVLTRDGNLYLPSGETRDNMYSYCHSTANDFAFGKPSATADTGMTIISNPSYSSFINFSDGSSGTRQGSILYQHGGGTDKMFFRTNNNQNALVIDSEQKIGVRTTEPQTELNVRGTISTGRNVARELGTIINISSNHSGSRSGTNVINGTKNYEDGADWLAQGSNHVNANLTIDLGTAISCDRFVIYNQNEYQNSRREVKRFTLEGSNDNSSWTTVLDDNCGASNAHEPNPGWSFRIPSSLYDDDEGLSYRYWRFTMKSFQANNDGYGGIMELELYEASDDTDGEITTSSLSAGTVNASIVQTVGQPSFHARLINHTNATQDPLIYDDVLVNVGNHYHSTGSDAGKFVVPVRGTYFFFWEGIKNSNSGAVTRLYIKKNNSRTYNNMHLRLQEEGNYSNGCMNAIMQLEPNDRIHIELAVGGVHASEYTHFGGYLIG